MKKMTKKEKKKIKIKEIMKSMTDFSALLMREQ